MHLRLNGPVLLLSAAVSFSLASCHLFKKTTNKTQYIQETYYSLKQALNTGEVTLLKDSIRVIFPDNLMFDFNMATVRPQSMPQLVQFANVLNKHDQTKILIIGRTDSVGGDNSKNLALSERRADSARAVLQYYNVARDRMLNWGIGAKDPIFSNKTEEGRKRNRCVEFIVLLDFKRKEN